VAAIYYDFGQAVKKGAAIAELDKQELTLQRDRARAALGQALARIGLDPGQVEVTPESTPQIRQARALLDEARFKYENAARLIKTGDISQERFIEMEKDFKSREAAYQAARDELRVALASIAALRSDVALAEKRLDDATVRAPFDGAIEKRMAAPGQYITPNTPIVNLVKTNPLRLRVEVPESAASEVKIGSRLTFVTDAAPGLQFRAVVRELNPSLEARSRSLTAEGRLANPDPRLRPGMFVTVNLALAEDRQAVLVPRDAIYRVAGLTKVFTVRDGRAVENRVTPGRELDGMIEIQSGKVQAGDQVAVSKLAMLTEGTPVAVASR
jgi:RND family efflux transporter MFP subunit